MLQNQPIVSKKWQKRHPFIQHITLFFIWGGALFVFQLTWPNWVEMTLFFVITIVGFVLGMVLNNIFAKQMIRVYRFEQEIVLSLVRQALTKNYIPFKRVKRENNEEIVQVYIRDEDLKVTIEPFPLNLPIDSNIKETKATKVEITGMTDLNKEMTQKLVDAIEAEARERVPHKL